MKEVLLLVYTISTLICGVNASLSWPRLDAIIEAKMRKGGVTWSSATLEGICVAAVFIDILLPILNTLSAIVYLCKWTVWRKQ